MAVSGAGEWLFGRVGLLVRAWVEEAVRWVGGWGGGCVDGLWMGGWVNGSTSGNGWVGGW